MVVWRNDFSNGSTMEKLRVSFFELANSLVFLEYSLVLARCVSLTFAESFRSSADCMAEYSWIRGMFAPIDVGAPPSTVN